MEYKCFIDLQDLYKLSQLNSVLVKTMTEKVQSVCMYKIPGLLGLYNIINTH